MLGIYVADNTEHNLAAWVLDSLYGDLGACEEHGPHFFL